MVSKLKLIALFPFAILKHTRKTVPLNKRMQNLFSDCKILFLYERYTDIQLHHTNEFYDNLNFQLNLNSLIYAFLVCLVYTHKIKLGSTRFVRFVFQWIQITAKPSTKPENCFTFMKYRRLYSKMLSQQCPLPYLTACAMISFIS